MAEEARWHEDDDPKGLGCWLWDGATDKSGTPIIHTTKGNTTARRWVWEQQVGAIPEGRVLVSHCEQRLCVRPRHHIPIPKSEFARIGGQTKLNSYLANRARALVMSGFSRRWVARQFDVSEWTIRAVVDGRHWTQRGEN